jgi:hypothetical protein
MNYAQTLSPNKSLEARVRLLPVTGGITPEQPAASIDNILNFGAFRLLRIFTHREIERVVF